MNAFYFMNRLSMSSRSILCMQGTYGYPTGLVQHSAALLLMTENESTEDQSVNHGIWQAKSQSNLHELTSRHSGTHYDPSQQYQAASDLN